MSYAPHESLADPARKSAELWRLGLGLFAGVLIWMGLTSAVFAVVGFVGGDAGAVAFRDAVIDPSTPGGTLYQLFMIGMMLISVAVVADQLHGRSFWSVTGPLRAAARDFLRVLGAMALLYLVIGLLPPWEMAAPVEPNLTPQAWLGLLPLSLLALFLQVSAEEVVFRGYLQQQLAARLRSPVLWLGLPSVLFALGHYAPSDFPGNAALIALWAGCFGLAAADLTARTGNLGAAVGLHFASNFSAVLVTALPGPLSGLALYTLGIEPADTDAIRAVLPVDLLLLFCGWLTARIALRR